MLGAFCAWVERGMAAVAVFGLPYFRGADNIDGIGTGIHFHPTFK
jgi:hypothetical protein